MHVVGPQVQPKLPGHAMAKSVARLRVQDHLRVPGRRAGEIKDGRLIAAGPFAPEGGAGPPDTPVEINPAWPPAAHQQPHTLEPAHLPRPVLVGDDCADPRAAQPVSHIPRRQQQRGRHRHRPHPDQAQHRDPPLRHPRQHDQHAVSAADPAGPQHLRRLATQRRQFPEAELLSSSRRGVDTPERRSLRALLRPTINHIGGKIEVQRHLRRFRAS